MGAFLYIYDFSNIIYLSGPLLQRASPQLEERDEVLEGVGQEAIDVYLKVEAVLKIR